MDSRPDSSFTSAGGPAIASSGTFWSRFTGTSRSVLEAELRIEREARAAFEGQCAALREEVEDLRKQRDDAVKNERMVYQMQVNANMQTRYGFAPFPDAPKIPDSFSGFERKDPVNSDYVNLRSVQAAARAKYQAQLDEMFAAKENRN
jgi:hypothetical protein